MPKHLTPFLVAAALALAACSSSDGERTTPSSVAPITQADPAPAVSEPVPETTIAELPTTTTTVAVEPEPAPVAEPIRCEGYNHPLHHLSCDEANERTAARRAPSYDETPATIRNPATVSGPRPTSSSLDAIRACESGGDYSAVSPDGLYYGAYQFDHQTWASVGGSGNPANASPAEQDQRAATLQSRRGNNPWPTCG